MYKFGFKRLIDLAISFLSLLTLSPFLIIVGFLIKVTSKGPIFYTQERLGYQGKNFKLYKFRSMKVNNIVSDKTQVFKGDSSITRIGQAIRRFKIDELAQLINVVNGDMSIVGPRPCLPSLKEDFNETAKHRLKAKPGLTGLAQINGNIFLSWQERWEYDKRYVENITFVRDVGIILKTVLIVFLGEERFKK
jgi:lipopolysaccharide/colanic/teichoic acid biosynthesis glycosyltransferase